MTKTDTSAELLADDITENALAYFYGWRYPGLGVLIPVYVAEGDEIAVFMRLPTHSATRWERIADSAVCQLFTTTFFAHDLLGTFISRILQAFKWLR